MGAKLSRTTKNRKRVNGSGAYEGFETFYNAYPRKRARAAAMKAWDKLQPDLDLQGAILRAIEQQRGCEQWRRDNGAYIPHPATWLNGRRWEDVVAADRPAPQGLAI
jgi:hypothetical protein